MFLVHNEQTKLTAAWLNALATALLAAGFFAPAAAFIYGISQVSLDRWIMVALAFGCVGLGAALHLLGRVILRRLHE
jgi:hypothetical protein